MSTAVETFSDLLDDHSEPGMAALVERLDRALTLTLRAERRSAMRSAIYVEATRASAIHHGRHRTMRWASYVAAALVVAALGLTAVRVSAVVHPLSPGSAAEGLGNCGNGRITTNPDGSFFICTESFHLYVPKYIPAGLPQRRLSWMPTPKPGLDSWVISALGPCSSAASRMGCNRRITDGPHHEPPPAFDRLRADRIETAWMAWAAPPPGTGYLEIAERAMQTGVSLLPGMSIIVKDAPASIARAGSETTLDLALAGVRITIKTNLGNAEALRVADSL